MRALGSELGVDPMAAYNHVPNKAALLDGVVEAVWADLALPEPDPQASPEDVLVALGQAMRAALLRHPNTVPLVGTRPNRGEAGLRVADRAVGVLSRSGVSTSDAIAFVNAAASFVIGHTMCAVAAAEMSTTEMVDSVRDAIDPAAHPALAQAWDDLDADVFGDDRSFEIGLRSMVAGVMHSRR